ncbi:MAG: hypothetical protein Q4D53_06040 [Leptotrichiaceae bacterium]|nr:hypothetical protein [Leptotrichiaceae bacterium]
MGYIKPEEVLSPKGRVGNIRVLVEKEDYSIVLLEWDGEDVVATRWNTTNIEKDNIGTPQSRGLPTWFILPEEIADAYLEKYVKKRELRDKLNEFSK